MADEILFAPCLPTLAKAPPATEGWSHEIKWDGYRAGLVVRPERTRVITRRGADYTRHFRPIAEGGAALACRSCVIDGEAVVLDDGGISRLELLQAAMHGDGRIMLMAFDLLELDGVDLRSAPLLERRALLKELVHQCGPAIAFSDAFQATGQAVYEHACRLGLEGVVSKQVTTPYRAGRQRSWIKSKCWISELLVIVGYEGDAAGRGVRSLLLGRPGAGGITYAGRLGAGLSLATSAAILARLERVREASCAMPLGKPDPHTNWVLPTVRVRVRRLGGEGLRHASIRGLDAI